MTKTFSALGGLTLLYVPLTFLLFFSQTATAAPATLETQRVQNFNVIFFKGLLTVQAKDETLKSLLDEIGRKVGIGVSVSAALGNNKVSVQFENLTLEKGLKAVLQSAGIVNNALVYRQSKEPGKIGEWVIDEIYLRNL